MDQIRTRYVRHDAQIDAQGLDCRVGRSEVLGHGVGGHPGAVVISGAGRPEGSNLQVNMLTKHPAQLGYVDSGAAIDFRRELFSHNIYSHDTQGSRSAVSVLV
jgi:hypothetical protein